MDAAELERFLRGGHRRLHDRLGAHREGEGYRFSVWAPGADQIWVMGEFDGWGGTVHGLDRGDGGIWTGFVSRAKPGQLYKFRVKRGAQTLDKADPLARATELPPGTASRLFESSHSWSDGAWIQNRGHWVAAQSPLAIYEVHLGSWARGPDGGHLDYRELGRRLAAHVTRLGYTHVELMPVMEHPFYGSWGYQVTSYFAPTARYGSPDDFKALVDTLHQAGVGVILDWVPSHFPKDRHGLAEFDGGPLYEFSAHEAQNPWDTLGFDLSRPEVRSFLLSSAFFWVEEYHIDGLRVDAVASMLHPGRSDASAEDAEPSAVQFLRELNTALEADHPKVITMAEESGAHPGVTRPASSGGLGFSMKWDMGWSHDTLSYLRLPPEKRPDAHHRLTFRSVYAHEERFLLPLSHDDVALGRGSLYEKVPEDPWRKYATLRLLVAYMFALPGKKLMFMGTEFGQPHEWDHQAELQWTIREREPKSAGLERCVQDLLRLHRDEPAFHARDFDPGGYHWVDGSNQAQSVLLFLRLAEGAGAPLLCAFNFQAEPRHNYRIGVPGPGEWTEVFNGDAAHYGGSGHGNMGSLLTVPVPAHGQFQSLTAVLPPLAAVFFRWQRKC